MLKVTGPEATHTRKDDQICAILKAGIDGAVYRVQYIWSANSTKENWEFSLIDAKNALDEMNQIGMLWTVCYLRLYGARFVFNFCNHHYSPVLRIGDGTATILHSREDVTQAEPLDMVAYSIVVLPLNKCLKLACSDVT